MKSKRPPVEGGLLEKAECRGTLALADFSGIEEALEFSLGCFGAIGSVANVAHFGIGILFSEVTADCSGCGLVGIGGSQKITNPGDDVLSGESQGNDWSFLHEAAHGRKEGHVCNVGVVLGEQFVGKGHHLDAPDLESFTFVTGEHLSDEVLLNGVGLEKNQGGFSSHVAEGTKLPSRKCQQQ